jgi:hypothetical protein
MQPHVTTCDVCGKPLNPRCKRFCSKACYGASKVTRVDCVCVVCGTPFTARFSVVAKGEGRCCSRACVNRGRATPMAERFWKHVDKSTPDGCWPWLAAQDKDGYGLFTVDGGAQRAAHRVAYELTRGALVDGLLVCHACDNPPCCRPDHLFAGSEADNRLDMIGKKRHAHGETHPRARLTPADVMEIRQAAKEGARYGDLAARFNVTDGQISHIVTRRSWRQLP